MSRPLLECYVRRRVLALKNVTCLQQYDVQNLVASAHHTRITGIKVRRRAERAPEELLQAGLIVDATGRGPKSPKWLETLGYPRPKESVVKVNVGYTTRIYRQDAVARLPTARGNMMIPIGGVGWVTGRNRVAPDGISDYTPTLRKRLNGPGNCLSRLDTM